MSKIIFKEEWLSAARELPDNKGGLLLECIVAYQLLKTWPPQSIDKEVLGAFKVIRIEILQAEDTEPIEFIGGEEDGKQA